MQLRDELARVIADRFGHGDQFFAERELVEALMVSRITVRRALDDLAKQGHLVRKVGRGGTTVRVAPADAPVPPGGTASRAPVCAAHRHRHLRAGLGVGGGGRDSSGTSPPPAARTAWK